MPDPEFILPQAEWQTHAKPTGRLRWLRSSRTTTEPDRLQQEWEVRWGNNLGESVRLEWHNVPVEIANA